MFRYRLRNVRSKPAAELSFQYQRGRYRTPHTHDFSDLYSLAMMPGEAIARAVVTAVTTPEGVRIDTLEVQPEAPREP